MENEILKNIIDYATRQLIANYGWCGVAEGPKAAMLSSDDGKGNDIVITIKVEED
jgi:hypothetical protein